MHVTLLAGQIVLTCVVLAGCVTTQKTSAPRSALGGASERDATISYSEVQRRKPAPQINPDKVGSSDDIVEIVQFWSNVPWIRDLGRTVGFQVPTYFVSAKSQAGTFVPGNVAVILQRVQTGPDGEAVREPLYRWDLDARAANDFRVVKKVAGGYAYSFVLTWPEEVRVDGKKIEIQFVYERGDGRLVKGTPREFNVPDTTASRARTARAREQ